MGDIINFKRGKKKFPNDYTIIDIYKYYKTDNNNPVSHNVFKKVLYDFHSDIFNRLIYSGESIRLFSNLGTIRIKKTKKIIQFDKEGKIKRTTLSVDWLKTKTLWSNKYPNLSNIEIMQIPIEERGLVYNTNDHTNRYTFKFFWDKSTVRLPNKTFYSFDVLRIPGNRALSNALKTNDQLQYIYFE